MVEEPGPCRPGSPNRSNASARLPTRPRLRRLAPYARGMDLRSDLDGMTDAEARRTLVGLPRAGDYEVVVKPLRYRSSPHLPARCEVDERPIVLPGPVA